MEWVLNLELQMAAQLIAAGTSCQQWQLFIGGRRVSVFSIVRGKCCHKHGHLIKQQKTIAILDGHPFFLQASHLQIRTKTLLMKLLICKHLKGCTVLYLICPPEQEYWSTKQVCYRCLQRQPFFANPILATLVKPDFISKKASVKQYDTNINRSITHHLQYIQHVRLIPGMCTIKQLLFCLLVLVN